MLFPSRDSRSRSSRSVDRELKHHKRYSLRIEFLDDDEDDELDDKKRKAAVRSSRSTQASPTSHIGARGETGHPLERTRRRSRRASIGSTTAVVGRHDPSSTSARTIHPERNRRGGTRSGGTRSSSQEENDYVTADELSKAFNENMTMRDRDEVELPQHFERHMSIRDGDDSREHSSSSTHNKKKHSYKHANAQTDVKGLSAYIAFNPFYPPPTPSSPFLRSPGPGGEHLNAEIAAYNNGFLLGRHLALSQAPQHPYYDVHAPPPPPSALSSLHHPDPQPPQPLPVRRPSISASSPLRPASARDRGRNQSSSNIQHRERPEDQPEPQGWRFNFLPWMYRSRREPSPPPRLGSRSSRRSNQR
ncbi:hypothetical protein F5Y13DRAFT_202220 [Hypoxylon sp. FL1857]|nr:hypothetical protein F5Y13DRAFT_202220 [Hypoxylon sp. FL1857]